MRKLLVIALFLICPVISAQNHGYSWLSDYDSLNSVSQIITPPPGFHRIDFAIGSFAEWLRGLPLRTAQDTVYLYNGVPKANQTAHHAIIDIDAGTTDLQQCADAVIRMRAEYLYSISAFQKIHFNFTNGDTCRWTDWLNGIRPGIKDNTVSWERTAGIDSSYANFRKYLDTVFMYAGTYSLKKELRPVEGINSIRAGDVFIQGGFPGHAVFVVDIAVNDNGDKLFLLVQGFTPAQDIHILKNLHETHLSPWYSTEFDNRLDTPEWIFYKSDLLRFE